MPGIAGIISKRAPVECEATVLSMVDCMHNEAFYTSGTQFSGEMGVYAGWVALAESFAADQPFANETGDIELIFGGECFPEMETRGSLRRNGHQLSGTRGDWLVHLYEEEGERFFEKLNGLFSGMVVDRRHGCAFLFNDRYGCGRLYVHEADDAVYFASEAKALLRILPELRAFSTEGVADFLTFGCTTDDRTLFKGIDLLPAGSLWKVEAGECRKRRYFNPAEWELLPTIPARDFENQFEARLKTIAPYHFESSSQVGISLTAGLDTRMIMACRGEGAENALSYTYDGPSGETLDTRLAARVAETCGIEHRILRLGADFFSDFASHADRTVYSTDGTFGVLGAHEIYLSAKARQLAPVRLTGVFGGEILRGVSTFKPLRVASELLTPELRKRVVASAAHLRHSTASSVSFGAFKEIPWNLFGSLAACRSHLNFRTPYLDNELVALAFQAPANLRASPLTALRLVQRNDARLARIATDMGLSELGGVKGAFRRLYCKGTFKLDYLSNEGLPHSLSGLDPVLNALTSKKLLFGLHKYLRYRSWFRNELARYLRDALCDAGQKSFWNPKFVNELGGQHIRGRRNYIREINVVLTLHSVQRLFFTASTSERRILRDSSPKQHQSLGGRPHEAFVRLSNRSPME